ncbi:hypothetical protein AB0M44_22860 [Streptosporangium subroseum]|uniref:hypothetical protein n=1 Tax=Streptosporangium subroseum TaxID=106412 RepID=UPI003426EB69
MGLEALARDGAAVRDAFATMGGTDVKLSQVDKMKQFLDYAKTIETGDAIADAFGRVMEAGTEAKTEKAGQHSPAAAAFALDAIRAAGSFGQSLPYAAKDSMSAIAKSYIHELSSGARFDKALNRTSGMHIPSTWTTISGVTPAFHLSPGDTYRFLKTFTGEKQLTDDFDKTTAHFRYATLTEAARLDAGKDDGHFERAATMFGDLGALEFKAALETHGEKDATEELVRGIVKNTVSFGIDRIPVPDAALELGWAVTKAYGGSALLDGWADSFDTQVQDLTGARADLVLRQKYDMAHILHEAGYPASDLPAELISQSSGDLKTYDEFSGEAKQEASGSGKKWEETLQEKLAPYEQWMDENKGLDEKMERASRLQTSDLAKELLRVWDRSGSPST